MLFLRSDETLFLRRFVTATLGSKGIVRLCGLCAFSWWWYAEIGTEKDGWTARASSYLGAGLEAAPFDAFPSSPRKTDIGLHAVKHVHAIPSALTSCSQWRAVQSHLKNFAASHHLAKFRARPLAIMGAGIESRALLFSWSVLDWHRAISWEKSQALRCDVSGPCVIT